jgi:hypothetical protein
MRNSFSIKNVLKQNKGFYYYQNADKEAKMIYLN